LYREKSTWAGRLEQPKINGKSSQVGRSWGPKWRQNGTKVGKVEKNLSMTKLRGSKKVNYFDRFWTPSWGAKIVIFGKNRVQEASWSPSEDVFQEKSKKREQKELKKNIFGACARKYTYNACASRSNIYSVSWLSKVCCAVDTRILPEMHVGPSWRPKMEAKTTPSGLQDGGKTDPEAIF